MTQKERRLEINTKCRENIKENETKVVQYLAFKLWGVKDVYSEEKMQI